MADLYPNLPSVNVTLKDGGLVVTPVPSTTKSQLVIGFATDGPDSEPYVITNVGAAQSLFGKKSELSLAIGQAYGAGCRDNRVLRLGGTVATVSLSNKDTTPLVVINASAPYSGSLYNDVEMVVSAESLLLNQPLSKGGKSLTFALTADKTIAQLITEVNGHSNNNSVVFSLAENADGADLATTLAAIASAKLVGGTDKPADAKAALEAAFELIENYSVDQIALSGIYADDITNYAQILAQHCAKVSERAHQTIGFISAKPVSSIKLGDINTNVNALVARDNTYFLKDDADQDLYNEDGEKVSIGHFISVVAMPELLFIDPAVGRYYAPAAVAYGGFVSSLASKSAPTNKTIPGALGMKYVLSLPQLNDLAGAGYVAFRDKSPNFVVADAPTCALPGSDYKRLSTLRITFDAISVVRDVSDPFLGEPNETAEHNALITAIRAGLNAMQADGAIKGYNFTLTAPNAIRVLGECNVELEIVPALERRKVNATVALRLSLNNEEVQ